MCLSVCLLVGNTEKADQQIKQVKESRASDLKGKAFVLLVGLSVFVWVCLSSPPPQPSNQSVQASNQPSQALKCLISFLRRQISLLSPQNGPLEPQDLVFYRTCLYQGPSKCQICQLRSQTSLFQLHQPSQASALTGLQKSSEVRSPISNLISQTLNRLVWLWIRSVA